MKLIRKLGRLVMGLADIYVLQGCGRFHNEEKRLLATYYNDQAGNGTFLPGVVMMVDGHAMHGGMSDRLRGMASVYGYCREHGIPFHIHHVAPFRLEDYLEPAQVNWLARDGEVTYCRAEARPVMLMLHLIPSKLHRAYLNWLFRHEDWKHRQYHVYSNTLLYDRDYAANFHALFRPVARLERAVGDECERIGGRYVAMVLRFQQLLGDFVEGDYETLPMDERKSLVEKCLAQIDTLHSRHGEDARVLVTSDSTTFLAAAQARFPYVHVIAGKVVHMDYTSNADYQTYMKSFLDMLVLSRASKIYLLRTGKMYKSGFAYRAAAINSVPYEYVDF